MRIIQRPSFGSLHSISEPRARSLTLAHVGSTSWDCRGSLRSSLQQYGHQPGTSQFPGCMHCRKKHRNALNYMVAHHQSKSEPICLNPKDFKAGRRNRYSLSYSHQKNQTNFESGTRRKLVLRRKHVPLGHPNYEGPRNHHAAYKAHGKKTGL